MIIVCALEQTYFHCCLFKQIIKAFEGCKDIMAKERNIPNTQIKEKQLKVWSRALSVAHLNSD